MNRCLQQRPPRRVEAFTLYEIDGLSSAEVCEIMALSPNNLWVMLHRARGFLRCSFDVHWFDLGTPRRETLPPMLHCLTALESST